VVVVMMPVGAVPAVMPIVRRSRAAGLRLRTRLNFPNDLCGDGALCGRQQHTHRCKN